MPLRYTSRLIDHLAHPGYRPETQQNIARDLRVSSEERDLFQKAVVDARDRGLIEQGEDERLRLPKMPPELLIFGLLLHLPEKLPWRCFPAGRPEKASERSF